MNDFKPSIGIEPTDDYINAKQKFVEFANAFNKLSSQKQKELANEIIGFASYAEILSNVISALKQIGK